MKVYRSYNSVKRIIELLVKYFEIKPISCYIFFTHKDYGEAVEDTLRLTRSADIDINKRFIRFFTEPTLTIITHEVLHQAEYDLTGATAETCWVTIADKINEPKMLNFLKAIEYNSIPTRTQIPNWNISQFKELIT